MDGERPRQYSLRGWLGIFHPAYRKYLLGLLAIGLFSGVLTYFNLELLQSLVKTFALLGRFEEIGCTQAADVHLLTWFIVCNGFSSGWAVALFVLIIYASLELMQAALGVAQLYVQGLMEIKSRNDIERETLINLLRKDDQFFQHHSATQIANRLDEDTARIFERREDISTLWSVSVQAIGALVFLWAQNWSYAAAALVFSLAGVYIIHRMLGRMKFLDGARLQADDNVKASFEDYLQAVPEAQMGNLTGKITQRLGLVQDERQHAFMGLVNLSSKLNATYALTQLVAFGAIMCAIIYVVTVHGFTLEDGLVAAVVRAVPQLYSNISEIAKLFLKFQLADVSARRLLEYQTMPEPDEGEPAAPSAEPPAPIVFDKVRYTYSPGGQPQGGPDGISLEIAPQSLNVIVGPSGSGKSMLSQLLMGRLKPIGGRIAYGERDITQTGVNQRSQIFSYMPQSIAMITGSITENILFGRPQTDAPDNDRLDEQALMWIDKSAVGRFAREKSLDMPPIEVELDMLAKGLAELRRDWRERVGKEAGVGLKSFTETRLIPHLTIIENMTSSAAQPERVLPLAFSRVGFRAMDRLASLPGTEPLMAFGRNVIEQTRHILERCPSPDAYNELAQHSLEPPVWDIRSRLAEGGPASENPAMRTDLILVGLTARPQEAGRDAVEALASALDSGELDAIRDFVAQHFGPALEPLSEDRINTALNWRDNLLFGAPEALNTPSTRAVDQMLLKSAAETELDRMLLESGLQYQVGRKGKRLSGGQRQLISLCRTMLQGCPVMVFDEPTAALDPRHRSEINALLREISSQHTVVAITHDAELARLADQVIMVKDGHLGAVGTFDALARDSAEFRNLTNFREAP